MDFAELLVVNPSRVLASVGLVVGLFACASEEDTDLVDAEIKSPGLGVLRIATFNTSLNRPKAGVLLDELATKTSAHGKAAATLIQDMAPHILLVNELDHDEDSRSAKLFHDNYLRVKQGSARAAEYKYSFAPPVNTGVPSGFDLDHDGKVGGPGDAFGFGDFEGQYGFTVFSKYPILKDRIRCFQKMLWKDVVGATFPTNPKTGKDWFSDEEKEVLRLSSKNHCDIPIDVEGTIIHALVAHPTPPAFDGPEDRNGIRNRNELLFWANYLTPGSRSDSIVDDNGNKGGLPSTERFVFLGDLNSDPNDGSSQAIRQLLEHPRVLGNRAPASEGGRLTSLEQGEKNKLHKGDPKNDTGDFHDGALGNLRLDYVLPSKNLTVLDAQVYWPRSSEPKAKLISFSDHRPVWIDVKL